MEHIVGHYKKGFMSDYLSHKSFGSQVSLCQSFQRSSIVDSSRRLAPGDEANRRGTGENAERVYRRGEEERALADIFEDTVT